MEAQDGTQYTNEVGQEAIHSIGSGKGGLKGMHQSLLEHSNDIVNEGITIKDNGEQAEEQEDDIEEIGHISKKVEIDNQIIALKKEIEELRHKLKKASKNNDNNRGEYYHFYKLIVNHYESRKKTDKKVLDFSFKGLTWYDSVIFKSELFKGSTTKVQEMVEKYCRDHCKEGWLTLRYLNMDVPNIKEDPEGYWDHVYMRFILICVCTNKLLNMETKVLKSHCVMNIKESRVRGCDHVRLFDFIERNISQLECTNGFITVKKHIIRRQKFDISQKSHVPEYKDYLIGKSLALASSVTFPPQDMILDVTKRIEKIYKYLDFFLADLEKKIGIKK